MSLKNQLNKAYTKNQLQTIKILKPTSSTGILNAVQTKTYTEIQTVRAYIKENTKEETTESGEAQEYTARVQIKQEDIETNKNEIDQTCRITIGADPKQWLIETMRPVYGVVEFQIIELTLRLPKEGNNIRYH